MLRNITLELFLPRFVLPLPEARQEVLSLHPAVNSFILSPPGTSSTGQDLESSQQIPLHIPQQFAAFSKFPNIYQFITMQTNTLCSQPVRIPVTLP
jgi:hypothetical protein